MTDTPTPPPPPPATPGELTETERIAALEAEVARLTAERDGALSPEAVVRAAIEASADAFLEYARDGCDDVTEASDRIAALRDDPSALAAIIARARK